MQSEQHKDFSLLFLTAGMLPIRCQVERVSSSSTHDHTQQAFLSMADKITDSMVERGEEATEILNAMERLQGIVFQNVYKGSIVLEVCKYIAIKKKHRSIYNCVRTSHTLINCELNITCFFQVPCENTCSAMGNGDYILLYYFRLSTSLH